MATVQAFQVEGFEELFKHMEDLKQEVGQGKTDRIWRKSLMYAFYPVLERAKALAPVDTGQLVDHLYIKVHKPKARDKAGKYYEGEMFMARVTLNPNRDDSRSKVILNKRGKFQTVTYNRPVGLAEEFGTASNGGGKPFLRPALESSANQVVERLGRRLWSELNSGKFTQWDKK
jgi:hypothetical protein